MRFDGNADQIVHHSGPEGGDKDITEHLIVLLDGLVMSSVAAFDTQEGWVDQYISLDPGQTTRTHGVVTITFGPEL